MKDFCCKASCIWPFPKEIKFNNSPRNCLFDSSYQYVKSFPLRTSNNRWIYLFFPTSINFHFLPRIYETRSFDITSDKLTCQMYNEKCLNKHISAGKRFKPLPHGNKIHFFNFLSKNFE